MPAVKGTTRLLGMKNLFVADLTSPCGFPCRTSENNPNLYGHQTDFSVTLAHQLLALTLS